MFPRETAYSKFSKRFGYGPSEYGNIQQTFYAKPTDPPKTRPSIWSKNKDEPEDDEEEKIDIVGPDDYSYFVINTAVGVGAKGQNNIKRVHIRFRLISMHDNDKDPEVVSIYPHSMSESVGEREITEKFEKLANLVGGLTAKTPTLGGSLGGKLFGGFKYGRYREELRKYILPYHVTIANASGTGSRAMWEFYQEEGMAAIGQFDLKVYFRIPKKSRGPPNSIIKHKYCIDWNVEVNQKRLVDHNIDLKEANWNMKVNGKDLMDKYEGNDKGIERDDNGKYLFWNVPVRPISPDEREKKKVREGKKERKKKLDMKEKEEEQNLDGKENERKQILDYMNEEDPEAESSKFLRPLYLLPEDSKTPKPTK